MKEAARCFQLAVLELVDERSIKQRLIASFSRHLEPLSAEALPVECRTRFLELRHRLTRVEALRGESPAAATIRKMSNDEAHACAQRVVELMVSLTEVQAEVTPRKAPARVQLYAAEA